MFFEKTSKNNNTSDKNVSVVLTPEKLSPSPGVNTLNPTTMAIWHSLQAESTANDEHIQDIWDAMNARRRLATAATTLTETVQSHGSGCDYYKKF